MTSGVVKELSPRTRRGVWGQWRQREETDRPHRMLHPGGARPRLQARHDEGLGGACKDTEGEVARGPIVVVIACQFLLPVCGVIGVVESQDNGRWGLRVTGHKVVHEGLSEPREVCAVHAMLKMRRGRSARHVLLNIQGEPVDAQLAPRVPPEALGIIAGGVAGGPLLDTLGEEGAERGGDVRRMPRILHRRGEAGGEAHLAVNAASQEWTKVRRQRPALEIGAERMPSNGRKAALLWARIGQKQTACRR